jgi:hypothetical protein
MTLDTHGEKDDKSREATTAYRLTVHHLDPYTPTNILQRYLRYGM